MPNCVFNFNVGVLGHVDSGKTSLSKALSTVASTASFDKNPQSKERGITLDLGFSSFSVDIPEHIKGAGHIDDGGQLQYTLVDCPGHASLIRTIIGGNCIQIKYECIYIHIVMYSPLVIIAIYFNKHFFRP